FLWRVTPCPYAEHVSHPSSWRHQLRRHQHLRRHRGVRRPKISYSQEDAERAAQATAEDIGEPVQAYLCQCGAWHVGRGPSPLPPFPLWDTVAFRSVDLWIE